MASCVFKFTVSAFLCFSFYSLLKGNSAFLLMKCRVRVKKGSGLFNLWHLWQRLSSQYKEEEVRLILVGVVSARLQHWSLHGFVTEASVNMSGVKIKPSSNGSCNGSFQTHNNCCLPKGQYRCILFLKSVIHMQYICEYLSLSVDIDVCKWILGVSEVVSLLQRYWGEQGFTNDFLLAFHFVSPLT